jgi:superfamily II DNA or RNA helicase
MHIIYKYKNIHFEKMTTEYTLADSRKQTIQKIMSDLTVRKTSRMSPITTNVIMFEICDNQVILPFYYAKKTFNIIPNNDDFPSMDIKFSGELLQRQKNILPSVQTILKEQHCVLLSLYCGFGKTIFAIKLATDLISEHGGRVLICCHRVVLMEQWKHSIEKFTTGKCQIVSATNKIQKEAQFYVVNLQNVQKRSLDDFDSVSVLIVDECHTIATQNLVTSMMFVRPKFCLGLSATPYREDGLQVVLHHYFGDKIVHKSLNRLYSVYIYKTKFKPTPREMDNGKLDWNDILKQQSENTYRNNKICKIARYFSSRNILILCKRVAHAQVLYEELKKTEEVDIFTGTDKSFDSSARILLVTCSKGGVGFDHPKLDMLIVAADVENLFLQYLGRVFRRDDTIPIVVDMKDSFGSFEAHLRTRETVYRETGGVVYQFEKQFPEFDKREY